MFNGKYMQTTMIAAVTATIAATVANGLEWPVWAMFIGWVAFTTGESSLPGAAKTYGCLVIGLVLGNVAVMAIALLAPQVGFWAITPIVFVVASMVVSLRGLAVLKNIPTYFLGLITFFAAHMTPGVLSTVSLMLPTALGVAAALLGTGFQKYVNEKVPE